MDPLVPNLQTHLVMLSKAGCLRVCTVRRSECAFGLRTHACICISVMLTYIYGGVRNRKARYTGSNDAAVSLEWIRLENQHHGHHSLLESSPSSERLATPTPILPPKPNKQSKPLPNPSDPWRFFLVQPLALSRLLARRSRAGRAACSTRRAWLSTWNR